MQNSSKEPEEKELEQNTMMNRALSYRLGFSIPQTYKSGAENDDPMGTGATRQRESPGALIRRTQSEDNTMALPTFPIGPHPAMMTLGQEEPGRKRSRTQSAGPLTSMANGQYGLSSCLLHGGMNSMQVNGMTTEDAGDCKRVHFCDHSPHVIPDSFAKYLSDSESPSSSPSLLPQSNSNELKLTLPVEEKLGVMIPTLQVKEVET